MKEKKIAILLENRFIDQEIIYYSHRFSEERIKLEFLTRLWGQPSLTFKGLELGMEKSVDMSFEGMSDKQMEEYVAIIVPAGKNSAFCGLHYKRGSKGSLPLALGEPSATPRRAAGGIFLFLWNFSLLNFVLKPDKKTEAKMRKILFMVVIFFLACFFLAGKQVATFSDVVKPELIQAKNDKLYVLQRTSIFIYSLKDFKLIKVIGKEGAGPKEFQLTPTGAPMALNFYKDQMVVNSHIKLTYFTLDGEYIREQKASPGVIFNPKENGFLGTGIAPGVKGDGYFICFRLFDNDYKPQTTLYETEVSVGRISKFIIPMNALHYNPIYKDKLFIVNGKKGFCIDVFDLAGKKLYTIEKEVEKLKVPASYKKMAMDWFKKHPNFRNIFTHIKDRIEIKEYFPPIHDISLFDDKIFVITNKEEKGLTECIVTDLKGKELKRIHVPLQEAEPYTYYPLLYTIHDGKYFALLENEDEEWELHVKKI